MKVVVTGGAGFIGANLVRFLNSRHHDVEVTVVDDLSMGLAQNLVGRQVDFHEGSILDTDLLTKVFRGAASIVHLAAIGSVPKSLADPGATHQANATGTLSVLEAARNCGVPQVVVASSSSVYGSNPSMPKNENDWTRPVSPYGVSKLAAEAYTLAYQHSFGIKTLAFRFFNVYGPLQRADHPYAAVVPRFLSSALEGGFVTVFGDGQQTRDFTYVDSVCAALTAAVMSRSSDGGPINLAFGTRTSLLDLVGLVEQELGQKLAIRFEPHRKGDIMASQASPVRLSDKFPDLQPTALPDGIHHTTEWFMGVR